MTTEGDEGMNKHNTERRLLDAETRLARALQRLHALRRAALTGTYDPAEFDQALAAYRRAEKEVLEAREAWARSQERPSEPAQARQEGQEEEQPAEPFEPTPRMHFVRWLVQSGRLSDWDRPVDARDTARKAA